MLNIQRSFESLIEEFLEKSSVAKDEKDHDRAYRCGEIIYEKFLWRIDKMLNERYGRLLREMNLDLDWRYEFEEDGEYPLKSRELYYSISYDLDENGSSEYEPLVKFVFSLDKDRLNETYAKKLFGQMDQTLRVCLKTAYLKWIGSMIEYHGYLLSNFGERIRIDHPGDDPERSFLTHEVIILD